MNPFHKSWFVYLEPLNVHLLREVNTWVNMESGSVLSTSGYWNVFFFFLFVDNFAVAPERSFFLSFSCFPGWARNVSRPLKFSQALAATIFVSASFTLSSVQAPANVKPHCLPRWYRRVSLDNICSTKRIKKTILQLKVNKNLKRFWVRKLTAKCSWKHMRPFRKTAYYWDKKTGKLN